MPTFMMISGCFWEVKLKKYKICDISVLTSRIKKLICPIFSWAAIDTFLTESTSGGNCVKNVIVNFVFGLWFMWALVFCLVLTFVLKKLLCNRALLIGILIMLFLLTPDAMNFYLYKFVFPFLQWGYS